MAEKLPKGWLSVNLGDVYVPSRVRVLPEEAENLPYVGMQHVESQTMQLLGHGESTELESSSLRFNAGDVLYGKMRPYLNKVWVAEFDGVCSAEFLVFPKTQGLNNQFLAYRLNAQDFVAFANRNVSGDRPRVDFEKLSHFAYWLAPSSEQDRIVAKLDVLLSRVASGEAAARRGRDRLQRYRTAVLHAAITGDLTKEWREKHKPDENGAELLKRLLKQRRVRWEESELKRLQVNGRRPKNDQWKNRYPEPQSIETSSLPPLPNGWVWCSSDILFEFVTSGSRGWARYYSKQGAIFLRVGNLKHENITLDMSRVQHVQPPDSGEGQRTLVRTDDILISITADVGMVGLVPAGIGKAYVNQHIALARPVREVSPAYIAYYLSSSDGGWGYLRENQRGMTKAGISLDDLKTIPVPLPPWEEQTQIVKQIERRLTASKQLAATIDLQVKRAQATRQSLLHEAFRGKLVMQDPNDEPASALLERIRAARAAVPQKPKAKRMGKRKLQSVETLEQLEGIIDNLGNGATPERVLLASGLADDVERFFDLLRAGRDKATLIVPVGKGTAIKRARHAN